MTHAAARSGSRIRACYGPDVAAILEIVNEAAEAYRGVIPPDCLHDPYMSAVELRAEIASGVGFWGYGEGPLLLGVMGLQPLEEVALIRHAYVRTAERNHGIGGQLLDFLRRRTELPILVGTWAAAEWAVRFYERHGFRLLNAAQKDRLLTTYWSIGRRQVETSVVLADACALAWLSCAEAASDTARTSL